MALVPQTANMTKLEAVNDILLSIGEQPVNGLSSGLPDAALAEAVLDKISRQVQLEGWNSNTRRGIELTRDANNIIAVPINTLRIKTTNSKSHRKTNRPRLSGHINATVRRSADDTQFLLYDLDDDSQLWPNDDTLTVDLVQMLQFEHLPTSLQIYIAYFAGRRFQAGTMASRILWEFTEIMVEESLVMALNDDEDQSRDNIKTESAHVHNVVFRRNPTWG